MLLFKKMYSFYLLFESLLFFSLEMLLILCKYWKIFTAGRQIHHNQCPLQWWTQGMNHFTQLCLLMMKYGKISYYCHYHYYAQICSNLPNLFPFVFQLTSYLVLVCLHHPFHLFDPSFKEFFETKNFWGFIYAFYDH